MVNCGHPASRPLGQCCSPGHVEEARGLAERIHGEVCLGEQKDLWSKPLQEISERMGQVEKALKVCIIPVVGITTEIFGNCLTM